MRRIAAVGVLAVAALAAGCNKAQRDALVADMGTHLEAALDESFRQEMAREFGPIILASLVGGGAPPGGPLGLLGTDAGWQAGADAAAADMDAGGPPPDGPPVGLRMFVQAPPRRPRP